MKVVLDTNVFISALVFNKKIQTLLETLLEDHTIIISPFILEELAEKLTTKFNLNDSDVNFLIKQLMELTSVVFPEGSLPNASQDQDDNNILLLAEFAKADMVITGDKDLYGLKSYNGIPILKPSDLNSDI